MSTLRTFNLQNPDSGTVNIEMDQGGNTLMTGIATVRGAAHFTSTSGSDAVGIGTDITAYKLDVRVTGAEAGLRVYNPDTSSNASGILRLGNDDNQNSAFLMLNGANNSSSVGGAANLVLGTGTAREVHLATSGTSRFAVRSDGKISAGTLLDTNNSYEFSIRGADGTGCLYAHGRNHYLSTRSTSHASLTLKKSNSDSDGVDYLQLRDSSNAGKFIINGDGTLQIVDSINHLGDTNTKIRFPAADTITAETGGSERLRINSSGQASLGSEPSSGAGLLNIKPSSGDEYLKIRDAGDFNASLNGVALDTRNSANTASKDLVIRSLNLVLWQDNSERVRINSSGHFGIGTANPTNRLHVYSSSDTGEVRIGGGNGSGNHRIFIQAHPSTAYIDSYGNNTHNPLYINSDPLILNTSGSGRVLINRTTPTDQSITNLNSTVKLVVNGSTITKHGYLANVGTSYTSIPGATVGNETSVFLVTVQGNGGGNFHSSATYILCSGAYNKTFTQLGSAAGHFGNGVVQAQLSSYSGTSSSVQVRRSGSSGTCNVQVHMLKLL